MGTFQLGAIVTNIAGSIGGTTFKCSPNGFIIMNKVRGTSVTRLKKNIALNYFRNMVQLWAGMSSATKLGWSSASAGFTFPDKFGVPRVLSGRQFYIKLQTQFDNKAVVPLSNGGITSTIVPSVFTTIDASTSPAKYNITLTGGNASTTWLAQVELSNNPLPAPTFIRRKIIAKGTMTGATTKNIYAEVVAEFPYFASGMYTRCYVTFMNQYGFRTVQIALDTIV